MRKALFHEEDQCNFVSSGQYKKKTEINKIIEIIDLSITGNNEIRLLTFMSTISLNNRKNSKKKTI